MTNSLQDLIDDIEESVEENAINEDKMAAVATARTVRPEPVDYTEPVPDTWEDAALQAAGIWQPGRIYSTGEIVTRNGEYHTIRESE